MAGWSMLTNGCALDCSDIRFRGSKGNPSFSHNGNNEGELKLRSLFEQALSIFNKKAIALGCIRQVPLLVCHGKSLDLFKLFQVVIRRGGFDSVNGFWVFVARELGLDVDASTAVKLVYYKYLYRLERWLRGIDRGGKLEEELRQTSGSFGCFSLELETEFRSLFSHEKGARSSEDKKNSDAIVSSNRPGLVIVDISSDDDENINDSEKNNSEGGDDDVVILDPSLGKEIFSSRKRKRESVLEMLNWVIQVAKCPNDITVGKIPPFSEWKNHEGDELWAQAIRARDALAKRKVVFSVSEQSPYQKNENLHPSVFKDISTPVGNSTDRLRCSDRLFALTKHQSSSCSNSCSPSQTQFLHSPKMKLEILPKKKLENSHKKQPKKANEIFRAYVMLGRRFQAEVPKWDNTVYESDPKWLGTKMWPLEKKHYNASVKTNCIGKGRRNICHCQLPGSVECVRFHIAENRMKLKLELGPVFFKWGFDRMGEEISLRWTPEEENKFKEMVRLSAQSLDTSLWNNSKRYFARKTREELVSYYFNVFVVQRRSYQNRVTPKDVDSDDDESEIGSLSDIYGCRAFKDPSSDFLICSENRQCTDFK